MTESDSTVPDSEAVDEDYVFDQEVTDMSLQESHSISKFDIKEMEKMDIVSVETDERGGETIVTKCEFNMTAMASVIGELDVVERKMGDDWRETSWNPKVRLKYLDA